MQPPAQLNSRTFSSPPKQTPLPLAITPHPHLPQPQATTNLLSVSMDLPVLDTSSKRHHTLCGLCNLASFNEHHVSKVHLCYSVYPILHVFKLYINFLTSSKACNLPVFINAWFLRSIQGERPLFGAAIGHSTAVY